MNNITIRSKKSIRTDKLFLFLYVNCSGEQNSEIKLMLLNATIGLLQEKSCFG